MNSKIKGGLYGLLIGDALGVPYEFHSKEQIPPIEQIEMTPPVNFHRSHPSVPPETWSDDGSQSLCLLDSLLSKRTLDLDDFASRMLAWYESGYMSADGKVFDVGVQTLLALKAYKNGISPQKSGVINPNGKGNGALMRVLPLVLWYDCINSNSDDELVRLAHKQCLLTHGAVTNQVCCALYCLVALRLLHGMGFCDALESGTRALMDIYCDKTYASELEKICAGDWVGSGGGYVVDCLKSAFMIMLKANGYEQAVKAAVSLGDDTDTTACVTGGLAGITFGYDSIPTRWVNALRGKDKVDDVLQRLCNM